MASFHAEISRARRFMEPYLKDQGRLHTVDIRGVVLQALEIVSALRAAYPANDSQSPLDNLQNARVVSVLVDLITCEGIFRMSSEGLGVPPFRAPKRLIVRENAAASLSRGYDAFLLSSSVDGLFAEIRRQDRFAELVRNRALTDVIVGSLELAFSPRSDCNLRTKYRSLYDSFPNIFPLHSIIPVLTSLIHPSCPEWAHVVLTRTLSLLPLRPQGVRQVVDYVITTWSLSGPVAGRSSYQQEQTTGTIPLEALDHASKLLSAVPSSVSAEDYFRGIAPQLLDLLDDKHATELRRLAGYVIGTGVLGKRKYGAPGAIGWELLVRPLHEVVRHFASAKSSCFQVSGIEEATETRRCSNVSEVDLSQATERLRTIILSHPNPGLTKRLTLPILVPLWFLLNLSIAQKSQSTWEVHIPIVLETYIRLSADPRQLRLLVAHLLDDSHENGTLGTGEQEGTEIRRLEDRDTSSGSLLKRLTRLEPRAKIFGKLLSDAVVDDDTLIGLFVDLVNHSWHIEKEEKDMVPKSQRVLKTVEDPLHRLVELKIAEEIMHRFSDRLSSNPKRVLEIIVTILQDQVQQTLDTRQQKRRAQKASVVSLGDILNKQDASSASSIGLTLVDSLEVVDSALSFLTALLLNPTFKANADTIDILMRLRRMLQSLLNTASGLSEPGRDSATVLVAVLDTMIGTVEHPSMERKERTAEPFSGNAIHIAREAYVRAERLLSSEHASERAEALATLRALINPQLSPGVDASFLTFILLTTITRETEEYVYLNAIKVLVLLVKVHPEVITKSILSSYVDKEETLVERIGGEEVEDKVLEGRLRVGEAIGQLVQILTEKEEDGGWGDKISIAAKYSVLDAIAESMITVAGRRGQRPKQAEQKKRRKTAGRERESKAERMWDGQVPQLEEFVDSEEAEHNEYARRMLEGWGGDGLEEDVRMRTSALSILGQVYDHGLLMLKDSTASAGLNLALAVVNLETTAEKAILRRAASSLFLGYIRALQHAADMQSNIDLSAERLKFREVIPALGWVRDMDNDDIVQGHIQAALEAWGELQETSIIQGITSRQGKAAVSLDLQEGLRGINIASSSDATRESALIEELE